jgi:hypothetical protein
MAAGFALKCQLYYARAATTTPKTASFGAARRSAPPSHPMPPVYKGQGFCQPSARTLAGRVRALLCVVSRRWRSCSDVVNLGWGAAGFRVTKP